MELIIPLTLKLTYVFRRDDMMSKHQILPSIKKANAPYIPVECGKNEADNRY